MISLRRPEILLITPPYHSGVVESAGSWIPLSLLYVGGALQRAGYGVALYDAMTKFHTADQVRETLRREQPSVVMVTAITATVLDAIEVCRIAKEEVGGVLTVLGGTHPHFMYEEILLGFPEVDIVARGEGEETSVAIMDAWTAGDDWSKVSGIAYRQGNQVVATTPRRFIRQLDSITPAWNLVPWKDYTYRPIAGSTLGIVSSSRGCMQHCSFCSQRLFWKESWRANSSEHFVGELEMLRDRYGVNVVMIADEIPTLDPRRWRRILDLLIEREVGTTILLETRVDDIVRDEAILPIYRKAGVEHIYVGVESVNQATLDLFKKDAKVEQGKRAIELIRENDMISETSFVMGMPNETREEMQRTIELSKYYDPDMAFFLAITPWPYADLYREVKEHVATRDYRKYNLVEPVIKPMQMSLDEVRSELFRGFRDFYMHKMTQFHSMPDWKQQFMKSLMKLLMEHSYLKEQMAGLELPEGMKDAAEIFDLESKCPVQRVKRFIKRKLGLRSAPVEVSQ